MTIADARDQLDAMTRGQLLRRVHDDSLAPRSSEPEVHVSSSSTPPAPQPGDPAGWHAWQHAIRQLHHAWQALGAEPAPWMLEGRTPSVPEAEQIARGLEAHVDELARLPARRGTDTHGQTRTSHPLDRIADAHHALRSAAGWTQRQPTPPACRTPGCPGRSEPGEHRRCGDCLAYRERHGSFPTRVAA